MDATLPRSALSGPARPTPLGAIWRAFVHTVRPRPRVTRQERELLELYRLAAGRFGSHVLDAAEIDDLDGRIDEVIEEPDYHHFNAMLGRAVTQLLKTGAPTTASAEPPASFGAGQRDVFEMGARYADVATDILSQLLTEPRFEPMREALERFELDESDPLDFVFDPRLPALVMRLLLGSVRAGACMMAMIQAEIAGERVEPWLARAILERWREGLYDYVRLLSSVPGIHVPIEVVPLADRLDVDRLIEEKEADLHRLHELAAQADPNEPFFPFGAPDLDDDD